MEKAGCALVSGAHLPTLVKLDETECFRLQRQRDGNLTNLRYSSVVQVCGQGTALWPRGVLGVCHHLADPNLRAVICKVTRTGTSPDRDNNIKTG
jgi:hypothetical protein